MQTNFWEKLRWSLISFLAERSLPVSSEDFQPLSIATFLLGLSPQQKVFSPQSKIKFRFIFTQS